MGFLTLNPSSSASAALIFDSLRQGFKELGYHEGGNATVAAKSATTTIPIVFVGVGDPVGSEFAASLGRPGGNLTGFSFVGPELVGKNLELLKQVVPTVSNVAVLMPGEPDHPLVRAVWAELERTARVLHITLQRFQIAGKIEYLEDALAAVRTRRPDALLTLTILTF